MGTEPKSLVTLQFLGNRGTQKVKYSGDGLECNLDSPSSCKVSIAAAKAHQLLVDFPGEWEIIAGSDILKNEFRYENRQMETTSRDPAPNAAPKTTPPPVVVSAPKDDDDAEDSSDEDEGETEATAIYPEGLPKYIWSAEALSAWIADNGGTPASDVKTELWSQAKEILANLND
jgi:hypothetical protein